MCHNLMVCASVNILDQVCCCIFRLLCVYSLRFAMLIRSFVRVARSCVIHVIFCVLFFSSFTKTVSNVNERAWYAYVKAVLPLCLSNNMMSLSVVVVAAAFLENGIWRRASLLQRYSTKSTRIGAPLCVFECKCGYGVVKLSILRTLALSPSHMTHQTGTDIHTPTTIMADKQCRVHIANGREKEWTNKWDGTKDKQDTIEYSWMHHLILNACKTYAKTRAIDMPFGTKYKFINR